MGATGSRAFLIQKGDPPVLLRNNVDGHQLKAEFSGLYVQSGRFLVSPALLLFLKDGGIVFLLGCNHVVDDPGEFVSCGGHGFWSFHAGFHAAEVISKETVAAVLV